MSILPSLIPELEILNEVVFKPSSLLLTNVQRETESREYLAHNFQLEGKTIKFRKAKITPKKIGQFVTIWKRDNNGITAPYSITDDVQFYMFLTVNNEQIGIFLVPKQIMHQRKLLSDSIQEGKRGCRIYPAWDVPTNKQAMETQAWQLKYFIDVSERAEITHSKFIAIFNAEIE